MGVVAGRQIPGFSSQTVSFPTPAFVATNLMPFICLFERTNTDFSAYLYLPVPLDSGLLYDDRLRSRGDMGADARRNRYNPGDLDLAQDADVPTTSVSTIY